MHVGRTEVCCALALLLLQGELGLIAWPWSASISPFLAGCLSPP